MAYVVDEVHELSAEHFKQTYVLRGRPVVIRGALKNCVAASKWTIDHLRRDAGDYNAALKQWTDSGISIRKENLRVYLDELGCYETALRSGGNLPRPAYLHDAPLVDVLRGAGADLADFSEKFFTPWYGREWWKFAQVFLGPSGSVTPLHFDCLLTHNLFFQVWGRKRFTLLPHKELLACYPYSWRWCEVDVEKPDYDRHPLFQHVSKSAVEVGPADILYMPPGTLHHVRSLEASFSFNVDWHTKGSALRGVCAIAQGMPVNNVYYNALIAFGLWTGVRPNRIFPYYRSYLNYVS